ncbi:hypothetical protein [[Ruminococcus] torques]|nr:hypothetical protein [[Ruminococcus] torques]
MEIVEISSQYSLSRGQETLAMGKNELLFLEKSIYYYYMIWKMN